MKTDVTDTLTNATNVEIINKYLGSKCMRVQGRGTS